MLSSQLHSGAFARAFLSVPVRSSGRRRHYERRFGRHSTDVHAPLIPGAPLVQTCGGQTTPNAIANAHRPTWNPYHRRHHHLRPAQDRGPSATARQVRSPEWLGTQPSTPHRNATPARSAQPPQGRNVVTTATPGLHRVTRRLKWTTRRRGLCSYSAVSAAAATPRVGGTWPGSPGPRRATLGEVNAPRLWEAPLARVSHPTSTVASMACGSTKCVGRENNND